MFRRVEQFILLLISIVFIGILIFNRNLQLWAVVVFVLLQALGIFIVSKEIEFERDSWTFLSMIIAGLGYVLLLLLLDKTPGLEFLGFLLMLVFILTGTLIAYWNLSLAKNPEVNSGIEDFRKKDDLDDLIDSFEITKAPVDEDLDPEETVEVYSSKGDPVYSYSTEPVVEDVVRTPLTESVESMESQVSQLSEKIKMISEAALREETVTKSKEVYASKSGTKYHKSKSCLSLKKANEVVAFESSSVARKLGLRACGLCK